jgi:hypothetical protein
VPAYPALQGPALSAAATFLRPVGHSAQPSHIYHCWHAAHTLCCGAQVFLCHAQVVFELRRDLRYGPPPGVPPCPSLLQAAEVVADATDQLVARIGPLASARADQRQPPHLRNHQPGDPAVPARTSCICSEAADTGTRNAGEPERMSIQVRKVDRLPSTTFSGTVHVRRSAVAFIPLVYCCVHA